MVNNYLKLYEYEGRRVRHDGLVPFDDRDAAARLQVLSMAARYVALDPRRRRAVVWIEASLDIPCVEY